MTKEKKARLVRVRRAFGSWTGISGGIDFIKSVGATWKSAFRANRSRLEGNIESRETCRNLSYQAIMHEWGIHSEKDAEEYAKSKQRWVLVGAFLTLFGGVGMFFQDISRVAGILNSLACLSVALLGIVLIVTSLWRLQVINDQRFEPFDEWVMGWLTLKKIRKD